MINLIGILSLIILEAILVASVVVYFMNKANLSDEEVLSRDVENGKKTQRIRDKNVMIYKLVKKVEELEDENRELKKELKRTNNKRLRQDS